MSINRFSPTVQGFVGAFVFWCMANSGPAIAQVSGSVAAYLKLQAASPGTAQTGHANISGTLKAGQLQGDGTGVTNVNASQLNGMGAPAFGQLAGSNTWSAVNNFTSNLNSFAGSGTLLTGLNASNLSTGKVADARLNVDGDLNGPLSSSRLGKIQGVAVDAATPSDGQVLKLDKNTWVPSVDSVQLPTTITADSVTGMTIVNTGAGVKSTTTGSYSGVQGTCGSTGVTVFGAGVSGYSSLTGCYAMKALGSNGAPGAAYFNCQGTTTTFSTATGAINTDGFLRRDYGTKKAVSIPIAYGCINGSGSIAGGTGNFSVTKTATGTYSVLIEGESYSNSNCAVSVTPVSSSSRTFSITNPGGGPFLLRLWDSAGSLTDTQFQFTVYATDPSTPG